MRNYYYALMRSAGSDERVMKLLDGKELSVEKIREFTEEETDAALKKGVTKLEGHKEFAVSTGLGLVGHRVDIYLRNRRLLGTPAESVTERSAVPLAGTGTGTGKCGAGKRRSRRRGGKKRCGKR